MVAVGLSLKGMKPSEIVAKVKSGEIKSCEYKTMTEYVTSMESESQLPQEEKNMVDGMIYDMKNMAYKIQELGLTVEQQFIQFSLKSGKVLQFMVDVEDEFLIVMLYDGNSN